MFLSMLEMRVLDECVAKLQHGVKARLRLHSTCGQEACRVSTAIGLGRTDLISDAAIGVSMALLNGIEAGPVLRRVAGLNKGAKKLDAFTAEGSADNRQLPWIEDVGDRLRLAMGAALSFKTQKGVNLVVAYVRHGDLTSREWRQVIRLAGTLELPILFVLLPQGSGEVRSKQKLSICETARTCGVPGIPVDGGDAVALYRVAQESIGRMRGGGGPVLIECLTYRTTNDPAEAGADPLRQMSAYLLARRVCSEAWMARTEKKLREEMDEAAGAVQLVRTADNTLTTPFRLAASTLDR